MQNDNTLSRALSEITLREVWNLAPVTRAMPPDDGKLYKSPFRPEDNDASFSITKGFRRWKDFGDNESFKAGNVWLFVKKCRPDWEKKDIAEHIIRAAGYEPSNEPLSYKQKQEFKRAKREQYEANRARIYTDRRASLSFPDTLPPLHKWPECVRERFEEGSQHFLENPDKMKRLAAKRGWPVDWVKSLVELGHLSLCKLPWSRPDKRISAAAFKVETPIYKDGAPYFRPAGYHTKYALSNGDRIWSFFPSVKHSQPKDEYRKQILNWYHQHGYKPGDSVIRPAPFVLGNPSTAKTWAILEGQWDAATLWGALGGFEEHFTDSIAVFGLRGVNGDDVFLGFYGRLIRSAKPKIWAFRDNDTAGEKWEKGTRKPGQFKAVTFFDRLQNAGIEIHITVLKKQYGKDFNDFYKSTRPTGPQIISWAKQLQMI